MPRNQAISAERHERVSCPNPPDSCLHRNDCCSDDGSPCHLCKAVESIGKLNLTDIRYEIKSIDH